MKARLLKVAGVAAVLVVGVALVLMLGETGSRAGTGPAERVEMDRVAVTVNGQPIMESEITKTLLAGVPAGLLDDAQLASVKEQYRDEVLESLVTERLLMGKARELGLEATSEEVRKTLLAEIDSYLSASGMSRADYEARVKEKTGRTMEDLVLSQAGNPDLQRALVREKLAQKVLGESANISEEEVRAYYEARKDTDYSQPAMVRASHILIEAGKTPEEKAEARKKAGEILAGLQKDGSRFEDLAKENSACPSRERGGDLGFFPESAMVKPFAEAAFSLEKGGLSGVVETDFGYHIIKVTDKKAAHSVSFEEARQGIETSLSAKKVQEGLRDYADQLKKSASIVYPDQAGNSDKPA